MEIQQKTYLIVELDVKVKGQYIERGSLIDKKECSISIFDIVEGVGITKAIIPSKYTVILIE